MDHSLHVFRGSDTGKTTEDIVKRSLGSNDVLLEMTHASVCGTDELYLHSSQVLGHEGVGVVRGKGPDVTSVNIGDRVGVGYIQNVCRACKNCILGWDQYCPQRQRYGADSPEQGCLGLQTIWNTNGLVSIPEKYGSAHAAALMCGGATAWTVLTRYHIQAGQRVGIIGVGGMGHLAVKLSAALGYHTVVFSRSNSKRDDCMAFGAQEFHVLSNDSGAHGSSAGTKEDGAEPPKPVDHLLLCSSASEDYAFLMRLVTTHGTIYPLTVSLESVPVPLLSMIDNGICIQGSLTASFEGISKLLEFCNTQSIYPVIQTQSMDQIGVENAFHALEEGCVRYKTVLEAEAA
ncbi:alcohol dehydrogenase [Penicillium brevicompactum]|uniref:Alcohol dehydrogenase n=1 Tax=Penicillium brevicompactum TaxID=5074 RepID=A0A9W9RI19_PENBR|nr:alcohol dehydrogenase [Penicillium brevicompactum]